MAYLASAPRRVQVEFSQDLARLLGYSPEFRYTNRHSRVSKLVPDLRGRIAIRAIMGLVALTALGMGWSWTTQ